MSTPGSRKLRNRVSPGSVRKSDRKRGPVTSYSEETTPPLKPRLRKGHEPANQKTPENGEHKRRKIERIDSETDNSMMDSSSQAVDVETPSSSSSSAFKSPNTKKVGRILRSSSATSASQETVKKLLKNAKGRIRDSTKRQGEANPGPSSSIRKSESVTPKSSKSKGPAKRKTASSSICDSDNAVKEEINLNSLEIPQCPLPCREAQFEQILNFIKNNVTEKASGCIYVSGVPGTGKTAIVQSVIGTLQKVFMPGATTDPPIFKVIKRRTSYVYINGLSLGSPDRIWKRFFHGLHHDKIKLSSTTALNRLKNYFETKSRVPVVLVIDELDQILDKQQSILYTLLEWAAHPSTMLSLVAIFNTMSLPENVFASRTSSRMSFARVVFPSYESSQLQAIVSNYLKEQNSTKLNVDAILLLSRKVAALSGDARRALEIAKRAVEIVEEGNFTGVKAVDAAFKEIFSSPKIDTVKDCSMLEQLFLKTVSTEQQRTGMEETTLMTVQSNIVTCAPFEGLRWSPDQFLSAASKLVSMKLIVAENDSASLHKKISLNIPVEDINYALNIETNGTTNGHHD